MIAEPLTESALTDEIAEFFRTFNHGRYIEKIDQLTGPHFKLHLLDLFDYDNENKKILLDLLIHKPMFFLRACQKAITQIYTEKNPTKKLEEIFVMVDDSPLEVTVDQAIKHGHKNKLVKLKAMINGETPLKSKIEKGVWICDNGHTTETDDANKPLKCSNKKCASRSLSLDDELTQTTTLRRYYLREINLDSKHSDTLVSEARGEFVNQITLGDTVELIGAIKLENTKNGYRNILKISNARMLEEKTINITEEDKRIFHEWTEQDGFYSKIIDSIAPHIYKSRLLKKAFLLAYIGCPKWNNNQRNWINVLSVGDPATAKSQIARWANTTLPNVEFVTSKAASAKGLFAGQKEQSDGEKILEIGEICKQSGKGLVCIDEFARMPEVFDAFYTPMETGDFNSSTVGGHATLKAETPIYATGNPHKSSFWDDNTSVVENLHKIPVPLLSRFDLIVITKDDAQGIDRENIARKVVGLPELNSNSRESDHDVFPEGDLVKYLVYCKTINPDLTDEIKSKIVEIFKDIMKQKYTADLTQADLNSRVIPTIIRLTLAIARLHLHREATINDVTLAHQLLSEVYNQRGLKIGNANTYIENVGQKVYEVLEKGQAMNDEEIYDALRNKFSEEIDKIDNDIGEAGPNRRTNKRWRAIMDYVENSTMVEILSKKPRTIRWRKEQAIL